jgi:hypothetical protein
MVSLKNEEVKDKDIPKNKMFLDTHYEFSKNNWMLKENTQTSLIYYRLNNETDEFKIKINNKSVSVTIPIIGGNCEYTTNFMSYYMASEYILFHINNYENKMSSL